MDIGIKESGLVHISQLKDGYVSEVSEVVKLHEQVQVKVTEVDTARKRYFLEYDTITKKQSKLRKR